MKKRKTKKTSRIKLRIYGIFDKKNKKMVKVSLDYSDIEMDLALPNNNGDDGNLIECEFDIMFDA